MADVSSTRGAKRKMAAGFSDPSSKSSSKVILLNSSLLLLEIPPDTNTSFPVWEAVRSQQVDITWSVKPYSVSFNITPATSKQLKGTKSSKGASTANVAGSSALSSVILQPQINQGLTQNTSCVLLTFTQNSTQVPPCPPCLSQATAPKSSTSLIVSLPLIVTQPQSTHQPSTPGKNRALPTIQTPTTTPTKMQAPTKTAVPFPFHTKKSSEVLICDNFLLNRCYEGAKCKMHHTPYPFHWQLWCETTHQWVDISPHSQVLLERSYCSVSHQSICIKDGNDRYTLNFDSMELDGSSKYDAVRRLTNSDSLVKNPHFPSAWKIYWWNIYDWEEYNKDVSTLLLKKMSEKESECSFHIGANEYKLDFTRMTQTNVSTGFERRVRCRPFYRSPDSMQPHLQTGISGVSIEATGNPPGENFNVDPLEEFTSWYPPVWCLSSEDYTLVDVPAGTQAYRSVQNIFYETMSQITVDIISIQQVQNLLHWDKYQRHKAYMQKQNTKSKEPLERHLFHGTTKEASEEICHNNFDPRVAGVNGTSNGFGSYFALAASYSNSYSAKVGPDEVRHMFLAKVLVGKVCLGKHNYRRPPPVSHRKKDYCLYDTCVDNLDKATMFVVFDSCQCYPYYLIKYKDLPSKIDI